MSTAKAAPRKLKVGDKVIFMLHDTGYQDSIKRNVWHEGTIDYISDKSGMHIEFMHHLRFCSLLKYVHTKCAAVGRVTIIRKVA